MEPEGKRGEAGAPEAIQDAAVIGVVIAGVLASFTIPGPFDWGSTLIGSILFLVLGAYGTWPHPLGWKNVRRAVGMATAAAFSILLIIARPLDRAHGDDRLLSHWPVGGQRRDADKPSPDAGWETLVLWFSLFSLLFVIWVAVEGRRMLARGADQCGSEDSGAAAQGRDSEKQHRTEDGDRAGDG